MQGRRKRVVILRERQSADFQKSISVVRNPHALWVWDEVETDAQTPGSAAVPSGPQHDEQGSAAVPSGPHPHKPRERRCPQRPAQTTLEAHCPTPTGHRESNPKVGWLWNVGLSTTL